MNVSDLPQLGAPLAGGRYTGRIRMAAALFAIVSAPKAVGEFTGTWLDRYDDVPGACSCVDSMANTVAMAEAGSAIANWARGLTIGGNTDWCLPARDLVEVHHRLFKPGTEENCCSFRDGDNASSVPAGYLYTPTDPAQTTVEDFRTGGAEAFDERGYWTSTQCSANGAFVQYFNGGGQGNFFKSAKARVRAVRLIQLTP